MKKIFLILAMSIITLSSFSQRDSSYYMTVPNPEPRISKPITTILVYSVSIILNGIGDGLNNSGHKTWGHTCNALSIGTLVVSPFIVNYDKHKWYGYVLDYAFLRYSLFDASYNITRGLPYNYIGTTCIEDKIFNKAPVNFRTFTKGISLTIGIYLPINNYK
jgi:hypothetical protein